MPWHPLLELNRAEAIFAAFHDRTLSEDLPVSIGYPERGGGRTTHQWDRTALEWTPTSPHSQVVWLEVTPPSFPAHYDSFIFTLVLPEGCQAVFLSKTAGQDWTPLGLPVKGRGQREEAVFPMPAHQCVGLRMEVHSSNGQPGCAGLHWWGVADSSLSATLERVRPCFAGDWPGLILPPDSWPEPFFARGLFFLPEDLPALRIKATLPGWAEHFSEMERQALEALSHNPREDLDDYLPWSDYRYLRKREQGRPPWMSPPVLCALVGLIKQDQALLRHALEYLMCFVHTTHWCQSAESRARGSTWDQRCFLEEMATTTCALLYDWLYYTLTDRARDLIRVAIWDKGLSVIQRDMVKWEYVYTMNQGPWFCRARILGGLVLEPAWPRVKPYTEQALADMREGMEQYLLPDGGVDEGVGYFSLTLHAVLVAFMCYARVRGVPVEAILPSRLAQCGQYVATLSSMRPGFVLLDGDNTHERYTGDSIALLSSLYPDDIFGKVLGASLLQAGTDRYYRQYMITGPFAFLAGPETILTPECVVPAFSLLPSSGHLTSRREALPGRSVRWHFTGAKARASHTHLDKGALTLELDEQPVLIDRGMVRYDDARQAVLGLSEMHNVLTPLSPEGDFLRQERPEEAVIPRGWGDARQLEAEIDLGHVWRGRMRACKRQIQSSTATRCIVTDTGHLLVPARLVFHLHTRVPWEISAAERSARLLIPGWELILEVPWAAELWQKEDSIDHRLEPVWHLGCQSVKMDSFDFTSTFTIRPM